MTPIVSVPFLIGAANVMHAFPVIAEMYGFETKSVPATLKVNHSRSFAFAIPAGGLE
jgi:hypothetical protein